MAKTISPKQIKAEEKKPKKTPMWSILLIAALVIVAVVLVVLFGIDRVLFHGVIGAIINVPSVVG